LRYQQLKGLLFSVTASYTAGSCPQLS